MQNLCATKTASVGGHRNVVASLFLAAFYRAKIKIKLSVESNLLNIFDSFCNRFDHISLARERMRFRQYSVSRTWQLLFVFAFVKRRNFFRRASIYVKANCRMSECNLIIWWKNIKFFTRFILSHRSLDSRCVHRSISFEREILIIFL